MVVSFLVDKAGSQEMAVSLNQGAAGLMVENSPIREKDLERTSRYKPAAELEVSEILGKNQGKKLAVEILKPFFSRLAQVGIKIGSTFKTNDQSAEEFEKIDAKGESFTDRVEIKSSPDSVQPLKWLKEQQEGGGQGAFAGSSQNEVIALLREYAAVFTEYISTQKPELAEKLKDLREKLKTRGVSEAKLLSIETSLKNGSNAEVAEMVKESIILYELASGRVEKTIRRRGLLDLLQGIEPSDVAEVLEKANAEARGELQGFALEELENELIKKTHLQDRDYRDAFKLINLAERTGLDYQEWLAQSWPQRKSDHGLNLIDVPPAATGAVVDTSTDNPSQNQAGKHGFEYEKSDENEVLLNRLRAHYLQYALNQRLKTKFKIRKLKNGLFRLGILTKDMDEQVKREAEAAAKIKIVEMLKEALIERATFYELAGPAHELVQRKVKGLLKNAERLGMPIAAEEFNLMRDNINGRIFELSQKELEEVRARRVTKDAPRLEKKEKHLLRLLGRLREESKIETGYASFS